MKTNFKLLPALALASAVFAAIPFSAVGALRQSAGTGEPANFCTRVSTTNSTLGQRFSVNESKLAQARTQRDQQISARQENENGHLVQVRQQADQDRDAQIAALTAKATTDAQKQAVINFQNTLAIALKTRRTAVDSAISVFRAGLKQAIAARETAIDRSISVYHTAVDDAIAKAQSDCAASVTPATVRQNFVAALRKAQLQFRTDRQNAEKIPAEVAKLRLARKAAIDGAFADFKATMEQARKTLKAAFPPQ